MIKSVFVPSQCKGEDAVMSGCIEMRPPFIEERWQYLEECGIADGVETLEGDKKDVELAKLLIKKMVKHLDNHIQTVDIKAVDGSFAYTTLEELKSDPDTTGIVMELCAMLLRGFKPSKN